MERSQILFYIIIAFMLFISLKIYKDSEAFQLKCIVSDVDGKKYCVRERAQLEEAADLLARTTCIIHLKYAQDIQVSV